jgi:hypothetical protein
MTVMEAYLLYNYCELKKRHQWHNYSTIVLTASAQPSVGGHAFMYSEVLDAWLLVDHSQYNFGLVDFSNLVVENLIWLGIDCDLKELNVFGLFVWSSSTSSGPFINFPRVISSFI